MICPFASRYAEPRRSPSPDIVSPVTSYASISAPRFTMISLSPFGFVMTIVTSASGSSRSPIRYTENSVTISATMNTTETSNRFATPDSGSSSPSLSGGGRFRNLAIRARPPSCLRRVVELGGGALGDEPQLADRLPHPALPDGQDDERDRAAHDADDRRRERDDHLPRHRLEIAACERREPGAQRDQRADETQAG